MSKEIRHICRNCRLYNPAEGTCEVRILHEGEKYELPVRPDDPCHWERIEGELSREFGERVELPIHQIRMWSDGTNGYIETPEDFDLERL